MTQNRTDKELAEVLIDNSYDTVKWATEIAEIPCEPATSVCGIKVNGQWTFPGGVVVRAVHEGVGLSSCWFAAAVSLLGRMIRGQSVSLPDRMTLQQQLQAARDKCLQLQQRLDATVEEQKEKQKQGLRFFIWFFLFPISQVLFRAP